LRGRFWGGVGGVVVLGGGVFGAPPKPGGGGGPVGGPHPTIIHVKVCIFSLNTYPTC